MNRDQFINEVEDKYSKTSTDSILIDKMFEILNYFKSISSEIENTDEKLTVGMNHDTADFLEVELSGNMLRFKRNEENISVSFVSTKDNQYTNQYEHLELDTFIVSNNQVVNKEDKSNFDTNNFESYLIYLLA